MAQTQQAPTRNRVKCDFPSYDCQIYFKRRYDMLRHKREYHQNTKQCPHPECDYATKRLERMTKHINNKHTVALNVPSTQESNPQETYQSEQRIQHQGSTLILEDSLDIESLGSALGSGYCTGQPGDTGTFGCSNMWAGSENVAHSSAYNVAQGSLIHVNAWEDVQSDADVFADQFFDTSPWGTRALGIANLEYPSHFSIPVQQPLLSLVSNYEEGQFPFSNSTFQGENLGSERMFTKARV